MEPREIILEFDARRTAFPAGLLSPEYRENYLYRLDVENPFTVDANIWPSALDRERDWWAWSGDFSVADIVESARDRFGAEFDAGDSLLLAFTLAPENGAFPQRYAPLSFQDASAIGARGEFLGFDVADEFLLSALCDCGLPEDAAEKAALRESWGTRLNDKHLFSDGAAAMAFKRFADRQIPEHAPFFVYGIWAVRT